MTTRAMTVLQEYDSYGIVGLLLSLLVAGIVSWWSLCADAVGTKLPVLNGKRRWEFTKKNLHHRFASEAAKILQQGFQEQNGPFQLMSDIGAITILRPEHATMIQNEKRLSFPAWSLKQFPPWISGFEAFTAASGEIVHATIKKDMTSSIDQLARPLSDQINATLQGLWGNDTTWHPIPTKHDVRKVISGANALALVGPSLCADKDWRRVSEEFATLAFLAASDLRKWPAVLQPLVQWLLPSCRTLRRTCAEARAMIARTQTEREAGAAGGQQLDVAMALLSLSLTGIHTTTDMVTQLIYDLSARPDLVRELREEARSVLQDHNGHFSKASLYKLRLLDSVLKESQRLKPFGLVELKRLALEDVTLPDNTRIPKNTLVAVSTQRMTDAQCYPDPATFDGHRFLKLRQQRDQSENAHQFASTSPDHLGFGLGIHSCPGRFLAAAMVKIAVCHIILHYDLRISDPPRTVDSGIARLADPECRILVRRRQEVIRI
ncbi:putative cytochrome P450 [Aspergillus indologenus CBS 114.80]|uniref:Putative cytochrome P450 n=1 Tax=Aspergillus indologenus CBS 114.80 TaxID=1450541 RepID=A0A2V5HVX3_9EURO|nr:putative cytochrome P450 [Aspergillus indologenus CBS 114.80]